MYTTRYKQILRFFSRIMINMVWWEIILPRIGFQNLAHRTRTNRLKKAAVSFRAFAIRMGGVLIKVGQFLSTRMDVLPREVTMELSGLQDEVKSEPFEDIRQVIETEFGVPLESKFETFDPEPTASASIGQVHTARLCAPGADGRPCPTVMVKVQRPHIGEIVDADLAALKAAGTRLGRFRFFRRHADIPSLIDEFSRSLYEEIDYIHEGRNAEKFSENFRGHPDIVIPNVIWSHTTGRVLTLEDVTAIKITDYDALVSAGLDRSAIAHRLMETYLKQIFEDGFFHADPHPGNLFVRPAAGGNAGSWKLVFVDFGMTGTLSPENFSNLRETLMAVGTRNPSRIVAAFRSMNLLLPEADLELIERAVRRILESVWGKPVQDILKMQDHETRRIAREFRDLIYEMPFQIPENLIMFGRCLGILSGLALGLDPAFNPWTTLEPYTRKLVEASGGAGTQAVLNEITELFRTLAVLPRRAEILTNRLEEGRLEVRIPELRHQMDRLERSARKLAGSVIFSAILITGVMLYTSGHTAPALGFGVTDALILVWLLFFK